jgi:uncharacterized protein
MHRLLMLLKLLTIVLFVSSAHAVEVSDLYQAKVSVLSQAKQDRNNAIKQAMQAVLLKVGGQQSVLQHKIIKQGLKNYQQYLIQFSYLTINKQRLLLARFNEEKINRLFHQANLPLWGNLRPQVLLWLVQEQGLSRKIIAESSMTEYPTTVHDFSQQRGLPISLPVMDLTDLNAISTADVWGRFSAPIAEASARYQAEAYVVIRLSNSTLKNSDTDASSLGDNLASRSNENSSVKNNNTETQCDLLCRQNNFALDWRLFAESEQVAQSSLSKKYQGNSPKFLLKQALNDVTQEIYQYYALNINDSRQLDIEVANVDSLTRYMDINHFLQNLSSVDAVELIWAQGEKRRFRLSLLGSKKTLLSSLRLNKQLQQYIDPLAEVDVHAVPVFYWGKR